MSAFSPQLLVTSMTETRRFTMWGASDAEGQAPGVKWAAHGRTNTGLEIWGP